MKKSLMAVLFAGTLFFSSCTQEVVIDDAQLQEIVDAAVAAALQNYPNTQAIADAAAAAATQAVNSGIASLDINGAIQAALDAADAIANPEVVPVGNGGVFQITTNTTWTNDKIWFMSGKVVVTSGATLTIEEGTIVKAAGGQGSNATVLVIAQGGKINAVGTAAKPIIFTDFQDQITYAHGGVSPNRSLGDRGKWGCVVILGKAKVGEDGGTEDIEGITSGFDFTVYGGSDDADSSGVLKYVSIRHTGTQVAGGDELQGLTMGGVGSGTVVENIELLGSNDDGIEIFGGSVNVTNLVIYGHKDDGIDLDEAYKGTISNALIYMAADSDTAFEIDGTEDSTNTIVGEYTIQNVTVYGNLDAESTFTLADYKATPTGVNKNIAYIDFKDGSGYKGIAANTYSGAGTTTAASKLFFDSIYYIGGSANTKTTVLNGKASEASATWLTVASTKPSSAGADESIFGWTQVK
jgi:hypothetical protein